MLSPREQIEIYTSDGRKGYAIADAVFADIIARLRRDARLHNITTHDWELLLADTHADVARRLISELKDRVHVEVVNAALLSLEGAERHA